MLHEVLQDPECEVAHDLCRLCDEIVIVKVVIIIAVVTYRRVHGGEGHGAGGPQKPRPRTGHLLHTHPAQHWHCASYIAQCFLG